MNRFRLAALLTLAFWLVSASGVDADPSVKAKRLRIAGWTMTAVGTSAFIAGLAYGLSLRCDELQPDCGDAEFNRSINGYIVMSMGTVVALAGGMPMLLRSRKLSIQSSKGRELLLEQDLIVLCELCVASLIRRTKGSW